MHKKTGETTWELPQQIKNALAAVGGLAPPSSVGNAAPAFVSGALVPVGAGAQGAPGGAMIAYRGGVAAFADDFNAPPAPASGIAAPDFRTAADLEKAFFGMLRARKVQGTWTWEQAMREIVTEPVYKAFPSMVERRAAFERFREDEKRRLREVRQRNIEALRPMWRQGLSRASEGPDGIKTWWSWNKAKRELSTGLPDMWSAARDDTERRALWDEHIGELRKAEREREAAKRKRVDDKLGKLFTSLKLTPGTSWREGRRAAEASTMWRNDIELTEAPAEQMLAAFEEAAKLGEREADELRSKAAETKLRTQRKRREAFIALLHELKLAGKITVGTRWSDIYPSLEREERYTAVLGQPGSSAMDLFWDMIDELDHEVEEAARQIETAVSSSAKAPVVTETTTWDEFVAAVQDKVPSTIDDSMLQHVFKLLHDRAERIAKDERRRAERRVKQQIDDLRYAMRKVEPAIDVDTSYETVRCDMYELR